VQFWDDRHMDNGWGVAMMFGILGIWLLVAIVLVWVIRSAMTPNAVSPGPPSAESAALTAGGATTSAERILAERMARGEIDPDEYQTRMQALASGSRRP